MIITNDVGQFRPFKFDKRPLQFTNWSYKFCSLNAAPTVHMVQDLRNYVTPSKK